MTDIEKMDLRSMDIVEEKREKLKELFPEVFSEGQKIDYERLKLALGESVDIGKERYGMNWPGKADCFKIIQQPSIATLTPVREESINFDETKNLFIEGDNLEVLKLLQKSYFGKIKMIYIDPPYNTGNDFIYPDNYSENLDTYLRYTGQIDDEGRKYSTNTEADGRFHSKWMNMMYPRLFLARNLLREDGVVFISIDDHEISNLRKICDEIFGEENFNTCITRATGTPTGAGNKAFVSEIDYILVYSKNSSPLIEGLEMSEDDAKIYDQEDEFGRYLIRPLRKTGGEDKREDRPSMFFPIEAPDGTTIYPYGPSGYESRWRLGTNKYKELLNNNLIEWKKIKKDGVEAWQAYLKFYLEGRQKQPSNLWHKIEGNKKATRDIRSIFDDKKVFDFPKPIELIQQMLKLSAFDADDIILDFFAGSCTTAHAIIELNKQDSNNRKFIMVQLPEPCMPETEAFKAGYKTIADIGKERIRRVIKKIKEEQERKKDLFADDIPKLDLGFKVFKLEPSNFKLWNDQVDKDKDAIKNQLEMFVEHINPLSSQEDILYELLLKSGFPLSTKIEQLSFVDKTVFSIDEGAMLICLEKDLTPEVIKAMAEKKPSRVVCLDEGFHGNDQLKTNAVQIMKSKDINFRTV